MEDLAGSYNCKAGIKDWLKFGAYTDDSVWAPFSFVHNKKVLCSSGTINEEENLSVGQEDCVE